jgi:hypothetical protein
MASAALSYKRKLVIEQHYAFFRHVANGIARAFTADA